MLDVLLCCTVSFVEVGCLIDGCYCKRKLQASQANTMNKDEPIVGWTDRQTYGQVGRQ